MKVSISSTYDANYIYYIPLVTWAWSRIGVNVIWFMPYSRTAKESIRMYLVNDTVSKMGINPQYVGFYANEGKQATYAQLSRFMAWDIDNINKDEVIVTSDADMLNFKIPPCDGKYDFTVFGSDLTASNQYPVCYVAGKKETWRKAFKKEGMNYQQVLDSHLGHVECENMRGNWFFYEQEELKRTLDRFNCKLIGRGRAENQCALNRYDRNDIYLLNNLSHDTFDFHMPKNGFEPKNFEVIMKVLEYHFPNDDISWLKDYTTVFKKVL